ncbi:hypothetical protein GCM10023334_088070 [Nonomuraea thailandensis]
MAMAASVARAGAASERATRENIRVLSVSLGLFGNEGRERPGGRSVARYALDREVIEVTAAIGRARPDGWP